MSTFRDLLDSLPAGVGLTLDHEAAMALRDELGDSPDVNAAKLVNVATVAVVLSMPLSTARRLMPRIANARKVGRAWKVPEADLIAYAERLGRSEAAKLRVAR
jgi:hypothetical protein